MVFPRAPVEPADAAAAAHNRALPGECTDPGSVPQRNPGWEFASGLSGEDEVAPAAGVDDPVPHLNPLLILSFLACVIPVGCLEAFNRQVV